jgi:hypothetical protein
MSARLTTTPSLIDSGTVDQAVVFDQAGETVLASSTGFMVNKQVSSVGVPARLILRKVSFTQAVEILRIFRDKETGPNLARARNEGFFVGGTLYLAVKADERSLYGQAVSFELLL